MGWPTSPERQHTGVRNGKGTSGSKYKLSLPLGRLFRHGDGGKGGTLRLLGPVRFIHIETCASEVSQIQKDGGDGRVRAGAKHAGRRSRDFACRVGCGARGGAYASS